MHETFWPNGSDDGVVQCFRRKWTVRYPHVIVLFRDCCFCGTEEYPALVICFLALRNYAAYRCHLGETKSLTGCLPAVGLLKSRGFSTRLWQYGTSYKAMCGRETEGAVRHGNGEEQLLEVIGSIRITDLARAIAPFLLAALCGLLFLLQLKGAELKAGSSLSLDLICISTTIEAALEIPFPFVFKGSLRSREDL